MGVERVTRGGGVPPCPDMPVAAEEMTVFKSEQVKSLLGEVSR